MENTRIRCLTGYFPRASVQKNRWSEDLISRRIDSVRRRCFLRDRNTGRNRENGGSGLVFDIRRYSIHDGPGIRTTVFLKGCPLNCLWCHNPEGIGKLPLLDFRSDRCLGCRQCEQACPHGARSLDNSNGSCGRGALCGECARACPSGALELVGEEMTVADVIEELMKDEIIYDRSGGGVTFSGGEPLMQGDFLLECLKECGHSGFHRAVDTCGYADKRLIEDIAGETELFLFDLKHMVPETHMQFTGVSNGLILDNLRGLVEMGARVQVRIPVIPGYNTDDENMDRTGAFLATLPGIESVRLLPYHGAAGRKYSRMGAAYLLSDLRPPSEQSLAEIAGRLERHDLDVVWGGNSNE